MPHIILHILLYVHSNISVICLVVITQVISHSFAGPGRGYPLFMPNSPTQFRMYTVRVECAIGLLNKMIHFVGDRKFSQVFVHMARIILHILLYVHSNICVIYLEVITQVISHSITGYQRLHSVHAKLTNTVSDAYTLSCPQTHFWN